MSYEDEIKEPYFASIVELLDKYEDGWDVFIKAHEEKDYDIPVPRKPAYENDPYIPHTWLGLADRVISIIAHEKYGLKTNPNRIEIVRADQMLDAYVRPVPGGPSHWSYGKSRVLEDRKYDASKHLAYEIIINSNPALAYCMDTNSPVMQMLVFAHASYGHNAFYKNNYLFADQSDPDAIMAVNARLKAHVEDCEEKYGIDEVERVLDFCHSMRFMDTTDFSGKPFRTKKQLEEKRKKEREARYSKPGHQRIFSSVSQEISSVKAEDVSCDHPKKGARNILEFLAKRGANIPDWKREIMLLSSQISQNFTPNMRTKVANEGMACITHWQVMETLFEIGLMNASMHDEFRRSHAGVTYQPPGSVMRKNPMTGQEEEVFVGSAINIYALGFAIYSDVKRICEDPAPEDIEWFPHFAGKGNWREMCLHMMESCSDETLVEQYMSPTVMRQFKYFMLEGSLSEEFLTVSAIHANEGFKKLREQLAKDYRISDKIPKISLHDYQEETDRCLILRHDMFDDHPLDKQDTKDVLALIYAQTKQPVVLESVNSAGKVTASYSVPEGYDYAPHKRSEAYCGF